jgi:hypothetical protein
MLQVDDFQNSTKGKVLFICSESNKTLTLTEQTLYSSSRLGVWNRKVNMDQTPVSDGFERGDKSFELSNKQGMYLLLYRN